MGHRKRIVALTCLPNRCRVDGKLDCVRELRLELCVVAGSVKGVCAHFWSIIFGYRCKTRPQPTLGWTIFHLLRCCLWLARQDAIFCGETRSTRIGAHHRVGTPNLQVLPNAHCDFCLSKNPDGT
jgi:hypothetical protein